MENQTEPVSNILEFISKIDITGCDAYGDEIYNLTGNITNELVNFVLSQRMCCQNCSSHPDCMFEYLPYKCSDHNPFALPW